MSRLSSTEMTFVAHRERFASHWPLAGAIILVLLSGLVVWLWFSAPYLIDPWTVADRLAAGTLPTETVQLMAAMLPVVIIMLCFFAFMVIVLLFVAFGNERRLVRILRRLDQGPSKDA